MDVINVLTQISSHPNPRATVSLSSRSNTHPSIDRSDKILSLVVHSCRIMKGLYSMQIDPHAAKPKVPCAGHETFPAACHRRQHRPEPLAIPPFSPPLPLLGSNHRSWKEDQGPPSQLSSTARQLSRSHVLPSNDTLVVARYFSALQRRLQRKVVSDFAPDELPGEKGKAGRSCRII